MRLNENANFAVLMLGIFCVVLGVAVLSLALVEWGLFGLSRRGWFIVFSSLNLLLGVSLLYYCRHKQG